MFFDKIILKKGVRKMIKRYQTPEMARIWDENRKFDLWLRIELAVLEARAKLGQLPSAVVDRIKAKAKFDVARIEEIELETDHDLLAFVQAVRENLDAYDRHHFHWGMTSYDTEEIPTNLRLIEAIDVLFTAMDGLEKVLRQQAQTHKKTLMIGRTHGQQAEPITFGFKLLGWLAALERDMVRLHAAKQVVSVGKISGAVGTYGDLDPEIEKEVCRFLGLQPADHATQILHRDRIAQVMTALAVMAGNIEHVALDFRLMAQTEICEVREPFGCKQKGSSRMPHKKNTIL
ncbi:MAG: adenylosuccinate lyase, partial [Candidatus Magasanikbacteria bacterium]|nr:adenylosuccinate lyase [Candidatus Magasanikbacteria bacterium]